MSAESRITVGLLHPGEMGAAVGTTVVVGGMPCLWASAARTRRGVTRVYLAGAGATEVAALFRAGPLEAVVLDAPPGAASALKMVYAGWNKGGQALLAAIRAFALAEGVDAALLAEWKISK